MDITFSNMFKDSIEKGHESGYNYADTLGKSYFMQEMKGILLSKLILKHINENPKISFALAQTMAKADPSYQKHIQETADIKTKENKLKADVSREDKRFEGTRSLSSLEKKIIDRTA